MIKIITLREKLLERIHHLQSLRAVVDKPPAAPALTVSTLRMESVGAGLSVVQEFRQWLLQIDAENRFEQHIRDSKEHLHFLKHLLRSARGDPASEFRHLLPAALRSQVADGRAHGTSADFADADVAATYDETDPHDADGIAVPAADLMAADGIGYAASRRKNRRQRKQQHDDFTSPLQQRGLPPLLPIFEKHYYE